MNPNVLFELHFIMGYNKHNNSVIVTHAENQ